MDQITADDGTDEDDAVDALLGEASQALEQPEPQSPAEKKAVASQPYGTAKFAMQSSRFWALVMKGSVRFVQSDAGLVASFEVFADRIRFATSDGMLACCCEALLNPAKVSVAEGGLSFDVPLAPLQRLATLSKEKDQSLLAKISLATGSIAFSTERIGKRGRRTWSTKLVLTAFPSAEVACRCDIANGHDLGALSPRFAAAVLRQCLTATDRRSETRFSVVEIEGGVAVGGHSNAVMVAKAEGLEGLRLSVPVRDCASLARILRSMSPGRTRALETSSHFVIEDGVVEVAARSLILDFRRLDFLSNLSLVRPHR